MPEPHERLDEAMNQRRLELRLKWRDLAEAAGITYEALRSIRRGESRPTEFTARALDGVLRWTPGSVYATLDGGEPIPLELTPEQGQASPPSTPAGLTPNEALRRVVRSSARELGVTPDGIDEVMRLVRQDLTEGPALSVHGMPVPTSGRTDLSDMARERRVELGMSLEEVSARAVDPSTGEHVGDVGWLDRLERGVLDPGEFPEYPQLDALADALQLDPGLVQGAAGIQFMEVHHTWSEDGRVRGIGFGELQGEDLRKAQALTQMYRKAPKKDG